MIADQRAGDQAGSVAQAIDDLKVAWNADLGSFSREECESRIDALIAVVRAEPPSWQGIESAPKDGTAILAYWPAVTRMARTEVIYFDKHWNAWQTRYTRKSNQPTHWMPLPAPEAPQETPP